MINPKGLIPFDTPPILANLSLANFKETSSIITIDGYEISSISSFESNTTKSGVSFPTTMDFLIGYMKNFCFIIAFFIQDSSYFYKH